MNTLFTEILSRPLYNILISLYNFLPGDDFGLAIIVLTLIVKMILYPLTLRTLSSQRALAQINPEIQAIKKKYKDNLQVQSQEIMKLYKDRKINPVSGCLPLLIQLPIIFALYRTFVNGFHTESLSLLYSFVENPGLIQTMFLGVLDVSKPSIILVLLSSVTQFFQIRTSMAKSAPIGQPELENLNKQMLYFLPIILIIVGWNLPAGIVLYWITTTAASIFEQYYIGKASKNQVIPVK